MCRKWGMALEDPSCVAGFGGNCFFVNFQLVPFLEME
jgi:hypothetical protein